MFNWIAEFKRWCPSIKILRFHSHDANEQARLKAAMVDPERTEVVVTTYSVLKSTSVRSAFQKVIWRSVILDEGHKIKNATARVSTVCAGLQSIFKVCVMVNILAVVYLPKSTCLHYHSNCIPDHIDRYPSAEQLDRVLGIAQLPDAQNIHHIICIRRGVQPDEKLLEQQ